MHVAKIMTIVLTGLALAWLAAPASGGSSGRFYAGTRQGTVPTRTPTPPASSPTNTPQPPPPAPTSPPGGGGQGGTLPTSTPETPTAVPATSTPVPPPPTPVGGYLPTAEPCGPPTLQVFSGVNVRQGPGTDYDVLYLMVYLEVRPIVGRAGFARWWLIELPDGRQGWVSDSVATVRGHINSVPIIDPPPLKGQTPTPGAAWNPPSPAACLPVPTVTPLATQTEAPATLTPKPSATSVATAGPAVTATATATASPAPSATPTRQPTATSAGESLALAASTPVPAGVQDAPPAPRQGPPWLLFGGLALILAGVASFLLRARSPGG